MSRAWIPKYLDLCGVPMASALKPDECERMREFLGAFAKYRPANVGKFIRAWREYQMGYKTKLGAKTKVNQAANGVTVKVG